MKIDNLRAGLSTPISKSNDFSGQSDDIWGARGFHFRRIFGVPGVRAGLKNTYFLEVLTMVFYFILGPPPSPGGSRGRVRTAIFLRTS